MPLGLTIVRANVIQDATGSRREVLVIQGPTGVLMPLLQYQLSGGASDSEASQRKLCRAVILLLEYTYANREFFDQIGDLFETFSWKLLTGTTNKEGYDDSGLYWEPHSPQVTNSAINDLTRFSTWMAEKYSVESINPLREATQPEQLLAMAAWAHRNKKSFLGHTQRKAKAAEFFKNTPRVARHRTPSINNAEPPRFSDKVFWKLIFEGFVVHANVTDPLLRLDLRCVLITLLQHGGGVRTSECFHLWFQDVEPDPFDDAGKMVRIGDPVHGAVSHLVDGKTEEITRARYLQKYRLGSPRSELLGKRRVGWKDPRLDRGRFLHVFWRAPIYGRVFKKVWSIYLDQLERLPIPHGQPWAFVNLSTREGRQGHPYQIGNYRKAHRRAIERIGLKPSKMEGTTPHGHRHAYIGWCNDAGISPLSIQAAAHHKSLDSQQAYIQPGAAKIRDEIAKANQLQMEQAPSAAVDELPNKLLDGGGTSKAQLTL